MLEAKCLDESEVPNFTTKLFQNGWMIWDASGHGHELTSTYLRVFKKLNEVA